MTRAFVCHKIFDDLSGVEVRDLPRPRPLGGQILVRVKRASENFPDPLLCQGRYQLKLEPPFTPGMNLVGEVTELGSGVNNHEVGDTVASAVRRGAFAEYALVDAMSAFPLPRALSLAQAAAYPSAYLTAYVSLVRRAQLRAGESLLVHGAAVGTGLATVDLAKVLGATVIATSAKEEKLKFLKN